MASKRTHDVTATIGEYTNAAGETKKRYVNCGSAFTDEQGRVSIKLDSVPCSPEWSGWVSLYEVRDKDGRESDRRQNASQGQQRQAPRNQAIPSNRPGQAPANDGWDDPVRF